MGALIRPTALTIPTASTAVLIPLTVSTIPIPQMPQKSMRRQACPLLARQE